MRFFDVVLGKIGKNSSRARCKGSNLKNSDYKFSYVNGDAGKVEKILNNELEVEVAVLPLISLMLFHLVNLHSWKVGGKNPSSPNL